MKKFIYSMALIFLFAFTLMFINGQVMDKAFAAFEPNGCCCCEDISPTTAKKSADDLKLNNKVNIVRRINNSTNTNTKDIKDNRIMDTQENSEEGESNIFSNMDYSQAIAQLNEKYKYMYDLRKELDDLNNVSAQKWSEFYAIQKRYNKELNNLINVMF